MNKLILSCILSILVALPLSAEVVTPAQARALAASYMKSNSVPQMVRRGSKSLDEPQPLYIFSRGAGEGFVMLSGDDQLPAVLGVTDQGDFDENDLPPALQDMIDYWTQAALQLQAEGSKNAPSQPRKAAGTRDIAPLMTSHWHQSGPYNNLCPRIKENNNLALTGCVATAASQIIYYWRRDLDDRTKYATPTYGYGAAPATEEYRIPSGTPLKWDLMQDSYSSGDPWECTNAVATLVACVGMSGWLTYGSSTSGQISDQVNVFSSQFGMNGGTCVWKGNYSQASWEKMIVQDLEAGRPILYSGVHPSNGGHAVVIDGYQLKTNLFHFNFGWGAGNGYDGYYTVDDATGMNGFSGSQGMVKNIYPRQPRVSARLSLEGDETQFYSRVDNKIRAHVTNRSTLPLQGFYLYCLTGSTKPATATSAQDKETSIVVPVDGSADLEFSFSPSGVSTYTIYLCDADKNILDKITNVNTVASVPDLTLNELRIEASGKSQEMTLAGTPVRVYDIYNSKKTNIYASLTNGPEGSRCAPTVRGEYSLYDAENDVFATPDTKTKKNVTFAPGATEEMLYDLTGLKDGEIYRFALEPSASTNRSYPIHFATSDSVVYFRLVGADLQAIASEDGKLMTLTGHYNSQVMSTLTQDSTIVGYDMTQVEGIAQPLEAANRNALFYVTASQQVGGRNVVADGVCDLLDLTPGYDFQPKSDFQALSAVYHATQAVGDYGVAYLPFDAPVPSGMMARRVEQIKTMYLQEVDSCNHFMYGGTPYIILTGAPVDVVAQNVAVSTHTPSLGTDTLRGTWTNMVAGETQYVLDRAETQYFNPAPGEVIPALTGYLEYTRKVRATSYPYSNKDKKARQLAQQIALAWSVYDKCSASATKTALQELAQAIAHANEALRDQPETSEQSAQIQSLTAAMTACQQSVPVTGDNGLRDMSYLIQNPSFEATSSFLGWQRSSTTAVTASKIYSSRKNYMSGAEGNVVASLQPQSTVSQTLTDIPNGTYQLEVMIAADYDQQVAVFAGNDTLTCQSAEFGPMYMQRATIENIQVTDGTLTIGAQALSTWAKVDNFSLYLVSPADGIECIESVTVPVASEGIYDLTGRRVSAPGRGIYIVRGKKVMFGG